MEVIKDDEKPLEMGREDGCVDDIEDIVLTDRNQKDPKWRNKVLPKSLRRRGHVEEKPNCESFIPGTNSVYVKTWGCTHNTSDGEYMAGLLASSGYSILDSPLEANVWLLNSCTVKGPSEDGFRGAIKKGRELGKVIVAAGCVPQGQKDLSDVQGVSVIGVQQIHRVVEVVEEALKGNMVRLFGRQKEGGRRLAGPSLDLPKIRRNPLIEIIPINSGCLNHCTYCKTKHARGDLTSYFPDEIILRAKQAFSEGVVEVWLTSEDTGAYGRDIDVSLPELLWQLVKVVPDGCMLRIGMTNPPYIMEHLEEMAKILQHPCVYSFLHVPVQSGADPVLAAMKREYTISQFKEVVNFLRKHVPGVTIVTDIICGFPTETEEDFNLTLQIVNEYKFPSLFINQFYPRPGTPAAKMKRLPTNQVKNRSRRLTHLFQSYETYSCLVGSHTKVLVTELSHDGNYYVGHTKAYEQVLISPCEGVMGKLVEVKITSAGKHFLKGELMATPSLDTHRPHPPPLPQGSVSGLDKWKENLSKNGKLFQRHWLYERVHSLDIILLLILLIVIGIYVSRMLPFCNILNYNYKS